jgi:hypothetical protein
MGRKGILKALEGSAENFLVVKSVLFAEEGEKNNRRAVLLSGRQKHTDEVYVILAKIDSFLLILKGTDMIPSFGQVC